MINTSSRFNQGTIQNKSNSTSNQTTDSSSHDEQIMTMSAPNKVNSLLWDLSSAKERRAILENTTQEASVDSTASSDTTPSGLEGNRATTAFSSLQAKSKVLDYRKHSQSESQPGRASAQPLTQSTSQSGMQPSSSSGQQTLNEVTQQFQDHFSEKAQDKSTFHNIMQTTFGSQYDVSKAETIRQQTLQGDFSWMPDVKLVDANQLQDTSGTQTGGTALAAYSEQNDTVYLSRELMSTGTANAERVLTEEVGHAIDTRININDAKGDEGDIFSRIVRGESISAETLDELKQENDSGIIEIDGKKLEVEYGFFSGVSNFFGKVGDAGKNFFDSAKDRVKNAWDGIRDAGSNLVDSVKDRVKNAWDGIKDAGSNLVKSVKKRVSRAWDNIKEAGSNLVRSVRDRARNALDSIKDKVEGLINNKWFQRVLNVAQFIPGVGVFARGINMALSAYNVVKGIQHGSWGAVLSGVANMAGGASNLGKALGASSGFVNGAASIATHVGNAATAYRAIAQRDFSAAAGLAANYFGSDSNVADVIRHAGTAHQAYESAKSGNYLGAIGAGTSLMQEFTGPEGDRVLQTLGENAETLQNVQNAVKNGNFDTAATMLTQEYGSSVLGLNSTESNKINQVVGVFQNVHDANQLIKQRSYGDAAQLLLQTAQDHASSPESREQLLKAGQTIQQIDDTVSAVRQGQYADGIAMAGELLNTPLDDQSHQVLTDLQTYAEDSAKLRDLVKSGSPKEVIDEFKRQLDQHPVVIYNLLGQAA